MQGVLARIDANGVCGCSGCLMGHSDVLLVLLSPGHSLSGSGREHGRSIPFSEVEHPICCDLRGRNSAIRPC